MENEKYEVEGKAGFTEEEALRMAEEAEAAGRELEILDAGGEEVVVVAAGGLGGEGVDELLALAAPAQGLAHLPEDVERVAVLADQLHLDARLRQFDFLFFSHVRVPWFGVALVPLGTVLNKHAQRL